MQMFYLETMMHLNILNELISFCSRSFYIFCKLMSQFVFMCVCMCMNVYIYIHIFDKYGYFTLCNLQNFFCFYRYFRYITLYQKITRLMKNFFHSNISLNLNKVNTHDASWSFLVRKITCYKFKGK